MCFAGVARSTGDISLLTPLAEACAGRPAASRSETTVAALRGANGITPATGRCDLSVRPYAATMPVVTRVLLADESRVA